MADFDKLQEESDEFLETEGSINSDYCDNDFSDEEIFQKRVKTTNNLESKIQKILGLMI